MKELAVAAFLAVVALTGLLDPNMKNVAFAATDVHVVISTAFHSRVVVTTGTVIRVDNWNAGSQGTGAANLLPGRVSFLLQNLDSAGCVFCNHTTAVSSDTAQSGVGTKVCADEIVTVGMLRGLRMDCIAADAAGADGAVITTTQYGKE